MKTQNKTKDINGETPSDNNKKYLLTLKEATTIWERVLNE